MMECGTLEIKDSCSQPHLVGIKTPFSWGKAMSLLLVACYLLLLFFVLVLWNVLC